MQLPEPGEFVRIRDERWRVLRCEAHAACAAIDVAPLADHATRATFLLPFDRLERLPAATQPRRVGPGEWRRIARRALADARPHWWSLRCATGAQISLLPFQLEPAIALARGHATRVLIADAVGLGKTIQAGLAIAETLERTPSAHVLVVCPAALRSQWQEELSERFALHAQVLDAPAIAAAEDAVPAGINPWTAAPLLITSIDFVKRPDVIRSLEPVVWDLAVFDEAHALAGRSDRATAAAALARRARAVVMLTATPHSGDDEAFSRLSALGRLEGDPPLATFRRTAAILGSRPRRRTTTLRVRPTRAERQVHEALDAYCALAWSATPRSAGGQLALMVLRRRAASSPASLARSVTRRIALLETTTPPAPPQLTLPFDRTAEDDDEPAAELEAPALADRAVELDLLRNLLALANACGCESKIRALLRLLTRAGEPAIVFTQYRDTLQSLAAAAGSAAPQLHGGVT
ncbi:MAG: SNF2-related protein, partial [Vicinamibacterales bacterium]